MTEKDNVNELIETLKQQRDELRVKLHLAGEEAKQEYERISGRIGDLIEQSEPAQEAIQETAANVWAALRLAAEEMRAGFERVRKSIESGD
jgi:ElaB/YqjD/DUF883 family membrane-anchored ribosome-binding protein